MAISTKPAILCQVYNSAPRSRAGPPAGLPGAEKAHRVLAMQTTHRRELVQDLTSFLPVARGVTSRQRNHQLVPCRHADLPHVRPPPIQTGGEQVK